MRFTCCIVVLLLSVPFLGSGQNTKDIPGVWTVQEVKMYQSADFPKSATESLQNMKPAFESFRFSFSSDGACEIYSIFPEMQLKKGYWEIKKDYITIYNLQANNKEGVFMGLWVDTDQKGVISFIIDETPLILAVAKTPIPIK